jgi:hypothetical protein
LPGGWESGDGWPTAEGEPEVVAVLGSQVPRIRVVPEGEDHPLWGEVVDLMRELAIVLDPWQEDLLRCSLLRRDGRWAAFTVAACLPRQNGKNGVVEVRELAGPLVLGEKLLIHTAHLADTSNVGFQRLDDLIDSSAWLSKQVKHIWRANGKEAVEFRNGAKIRFRTRTRGGGRGFSGSPVFFDEAMFLPEVSMGSILPVVSAQPDPQVWYTGSAVDQQIHDEGVSFARVRDRALAGEDDRLVYFEWSLDATSPEMLEPDVAGSEAAWAAANPALGIRITSEYVKAERQELDARTFAVERLGVGDWPVTDGSKQLVFSLEHWDENEDLAAEITGQLVFAFDVAPDRSSSAVAVAGRRADGRVHVEIAEHQRGTRWLVPWLIERNQRHTPTAIICSGSPITGSLVPDLENVGVMVTVLNATEYGQACVALVDAVEEGTMTHLGTRELRDAIKGAAKRNLGDSWAWSRKSSSTDISPLVAGSLAHWGAATAPSTNYVVDVAALMATG